MRPDMQNYNPNEWIYHQFDEDSINEDDMPDYNE